MKCINIMNIKVIIYQKVKEDFLLLEYFMMKKKTMKILLIIMKMIIIKIFILWLEKIKFYYLKIIKILLNGILKIIKMN